MFTLVFKTTNAAYRDENDSLIPEVVADNVQQVVQEILDGKTYGVVMDYNGNRVGEWKLTEE